MMFISKCSFLQNYYNETGFVSRNSHMYHLFSIRIYNVTHIKILLFRLSIQYTLNCT